MQKLKNPVRTLNISEIAFLFTLLVPAMTTGCQWNGTIMLNDDTTVAESSENETDDMPADSETDSWPETESCEQIVSVKMKVPLDYSEESIYLLCLYTSGASEVSDVPDTADTSEVSFSAYASSQAITCLSDPRPKIESGQFSISFEIPHWDDNELVYVGAIVYLQTEGRTDFDALLPGTDLYGVSTHPIIESGSDPCKLNGGTVNLEDVLDISRTDQ